MKVVSVFVLAFCVSPSVFAAPVCPELFLASMPEINSHFRLINEENDPNLYQVDVDRFQYLTTSKAGMINCTDITGQTPLIYTLDIQDNPCLLPEAAQFLLDQGADALAIDSYRKFSPLYYATEAYGTMFGTPDPIELKDESCAEHHTQAQLKKIIASLIQKGANPDDRGEVGKSARDIAREYKVSDLFK